tara:strand:- start:1485 stop:1703 length:219 start_codon:yes stop_codon:yes gene_type:complete
MMTDKVILDGWYETEEGLLPVYETGDNLDEIVTRLVAFDEDFGHTDMEFQLTYKSGLELDITKRIQSIVERL